MPNLYLTIKSRKLPRAIMKRNSKGSWHLPQPIQTYNNKRRLIWLQQPLRDLDSPISLLGLNRHNLTGLKVRASPFRLVLEWTIQRGVVTRNSSPPLNMPHPPQSSESQPFQLPVLPRPDIPVGGRLARFMEQWEKLTDNKWVLSIV